MPVTKIAVIGAGVIGLSSAVNIIEHVPDVDVTIISDSFSPNTTGDNSAGFWEPFSSNGPKIIKWSDVTFKHMVDLARSELAGKLGAQFCSGYQLGFEDPEWSDIVLGFRPMTNDELALFPKSGASSGFFFTSVMIECTLYLPWLMTRFKEKGGKVIHRKVEDIGELAEDFDLVVNCCGFGAVSLVRDHLVRPIRGQVMKVHAPWMKHFMVSVQGYGPGEAAYIFPGAKAVTVGGTFTDGEWSEEVSDKDRRAIWRRCTDLVPSLKEAKHLHDWAGLRPFRPEVRLERGDITVKGKKLPVIHNYGHGGSGVTIHWGCALDATDLVRGVLQEARDNRQTPPLSKL